MPVGSDVNEITWNHPTLGTGVIYGKAGEAGTLDPGGVRANDDAAGVDGAGNMIATMTRVRWSFENVCAWNDNTQTDSDTLNALMGSTEEATWTVAMLDGRVYVGKGRMVGDLNFDTAAATFTIKIAGGGKAQKLS